MLKSLNISFEYEAKDESWRKVTKRDPFYKRNEYIIVKLLEISPWFVEEVESFRRVNKIEEPFIDTKELLDMRYSFFEENKITNKNLFNLYSLTDDFCRKLWNAPQMSIARNYLYDYSILIDIVLSNNVYYFVHNMNTGLKLLEGKNISPSKDCVYIEISKDIDITAINKYIKDNSERLKEMLRWHKLPIKNKKLTFSDNDLKLLRYGFSNSKRKFVEASNDDDFKLATAKELNDQFSDKVKILKSLGLLDLFEGKIEN